MKILLYNINSFGGNYEYSLALARSYLGRSEVKELSVWMPVNSGADDEFVKKVLKSDIPPYRNRFLRKIYFFYRSVMNPLFLYRMLKKEEATVVIFNDFDQVSSFLWAPLFRKLKKRHLFTVLLHDPDRDSYLSSRSLSVLTMKQVMSVMDIALFHGFLPNKSYYADPELVKQEVPHGIFPPAAPDPGFLELLTGKKKGHTLLGILGNIREEKNYWLAFDALKDLPGCMLLVAGNLASSGVDEQAYLDRINELGIGNRVIWIRKYLSEGEMNAAIIACDVILLYYRPSFKSQSGILNKIAPYKKRLVVSKIESSLMESVRMHDIGIVADPEEKAHLKEGIEQSLAKSEIEVEVAWERYLAYASWERHVAIAMDCFKEKISV